VQLGNSAGKLLGHGNSGGVLFHAPPPVQVTESVDRERLPLLGLPMPAVTCKTNENTTGS